MYIFISHSSKDAAIASELTQALETAGNACFIAPRDIRGGHEYAEEIINGIDKSDAMAVVLSENANNSPHVLREVERAVSRAIPIIIYKIEEVRLTRSMEYFLMTHQWINAADDKGYRRILECIDSLKDSKDGTHEEKEHLKQKMFPRKHTLKPAYAAVLCAVIAAAVIYMIFCNGFHAGNNNIFLGDTVVLGTYNDMPINWRVINISDDRQEAVLVCENIITMKAFDAAESGRYNHDGTAYIKTGENLDGDWQRQTAAFGNSDWSSSNIRKWLNSDMEVVDYEDQEPSVKAMSDMKNGYDNEAGFLHNFTEKEKSAIKETKLQTKGNALAEDMIVTTDKVYLLSRDELAWFDESGVSKFAVPTQEAVEKDQTKWYKSYSLDLNVDAYLWWLRDAQETNACKCYTFGNGYADEDIFVNNAGVEGFGIRPAITVDTDAVSRLGRK